MPQYRVRVFDSQSGRTTTNTFSAASKSEALQAAAANGSVVLSTSTVGGWRATRIVQPDIGLFCEELATLLRAGLNVVEALDALGSQQDSSAAPLYRELAAELQQGRTLSFVLGARIADFPAVLVASIRSSERTGRIADALEQYGKFHHAMQDLRRKLVSAAIYPSLVISFGGLVALFLLFFVIPRFASVYVGHAAQPSLTSRILIKLSEHMAAYRSVWLVLLVVAAMALFATIQSGALKRALLALAIQIKVVKHWLRLFEMAEVYRSMAMLLRGGFTLVEALNLCKDAPAEVILRQKIVHVAQQVEEGAQLSTALQAQDIADMIALRLLAAGERSGELPSVLEAIADDHSRRVERRLDRAMRLAEPIIMIAIGALVGSLVLLMYMPIFDLAGALT